NPRSTVGTVTEIYDYIRLLYARIGRTYCRQCQGEVKKDVLDDVVELLLSLPAETRVYVLFPLSAYRKRQEMHEAVGREKRRRKSGSKEQDVLKIILGDLRRHGFNRLYQAGQIYEFSTPESLLNLDFASDVFVLVDRVVILNNVRQRLMDSLEICYREGN